MLSPKEKAEKMRKAPSNSTRFFRLKTAQQREEIKHKEAEHASADSTDQYAYNRALEVNGK